MGVKRCKEQKVRELDLIKDDSEKSAKGLNRYLNYESICTGETVKAIQGDYAQIVQQKQVVPWNKLRKHVPCQFRTIPLELRHVIVPSNAEDNEVFFNKTAWKVACIRWWGGDKWKEPVPSWENVEEMVSSTQFSLESILGCDIYERCVKYLMQTTRSAKEFRKWLKRYRNIRNMSKWLGWYMGLSPKKVQEIIEEVKKEHNTTREDNKDAKNKNT